MARIPPTVRAKDSSMVKMPAKPMAWLSESSPESFSTASAMAQMA